jgi:hypothetical protein
MSLFQICYGPEILAINNTIRLNPGINRTELVKRYQLNTDNDITSLVDAVINFLLNLKFITVDREKSLWSRHTDPVEKLDYIVKLTEINNTSGGLSDQNFVFSRVYFDSFVMPNQLFIKDMHYITNLNYDKVSISHEKINAWKRIMEFFGLGYRMYGGFYALPQPKLMENIINRIGPWEGPLQQYFEKEINKYLPCFYNGNIFNGVKYSLLNLNENKKVNLLKKQDLPFPSFGEHSEFNWIKVKGDLV